MHWRSWSKVCMPLDEGGLGLRNFKEVKLSLHTKFAYRILTQHNLWIEFFCAKFHKDSHISLVNGKISDSRFWRSILTVILEVLNNVKVLVIRGNASFWYDRWLASGPLAVVDDITNPRLRINECWMNQFWNVEKLLEIVGEELV